RLLFLWWLSVLGNISVERLRMYVKVELKRFRVVKEVGRIVMNVRIFACCQLIEVCQ
uniref:Uncharacterized protein n=1 Tax=Setaria italica TaxID=4555 RepID=K3XRR9_SETIT